MPEHYARIDPEKKPITILVVEDNAADVKIAQRAFCNSRYETKLFFVEDGQECLDFIRHEQGYSDEETYPRPDLILVDINMPRIDGFGVLSTLKNDPAYSSIPIIVFSSSQNAVDVERSYQSGANGFIQKPVSYEDFSELIEGFNYYWQVISRLPKHKEV